MTKGKKAGVLILSVLLGCNLCFIWGNSMLSRTDSSTLSFDVLALLPSFIKDLFPDREQLGHILRKLAHFTEFLSLGGLSTGLLLLLGQRKLHPLLHLLCGGFFVAAMDETIQIFSHRGSQLQDVWLDFAGFTAGFLLLLGADALRRRRSPQQKQ